MYAIRACENLTVEALRKSTCWQVACPARHFPLPANSWETRALVLDRNGFTCQMCGAVAGEPHPYDPNRKTRLHIGHIVDMEK